MKNKNIERLIDELHDTICKELPEQNEYFVNTLRTNLKESIICSIKNIIYMNDDLLDEIFVTPELLIYLSKFVDLDKLLHTNTYLLYKIFIDQEYWLQLRLVRFDDNHFPVFAISNIMNILSFAKIGRYALINHIKSSDEYLYKLLELDCNEDTTSETDIHINPKLSDNSWKEVIYASEHNCIPDTWNIGDEINLVLYGGFNKIITLQIWDFNHFDKSDGTGKAGILFGIKGLMYDDECISPYDTMDITSICWNLSYMRNTVMNRIYESIPYYVKDHIKEVYTYANAGNGSKNESKGLICTDKVFIPGLSEVCDEWEEQNQTETGQSIISIFKDKKNRIRKDNNGYGKIEYWWTRSPYYTGGSNFCGFDTDGGWNDYFADNSYGVCVCFNV